MPTPPFEYAKELSAITGSGHPCPGPSAISAQGTAWRWVHKPRDPNDFLPQAKRNPARLARAKSLEEQCSLWGLSMHRTLAQSKAAYAHLKNLFQNADKIFGGHSESGALSPGMGVTTPEDSHGHFDLHPFKGANIGSAFSNTQAIP